MTGDTHAKKVIDSLYKELNDKRTELEETGFGSYTEGLFKNVEDKIKIFETNLMNKTNQMEDVMIPAIQSDIMFLHSEIASIKIIDEPTETNKALWIK